MTAFKASEQTSSLDPFFTTPLASSVSVLSRSCNFCRCFAPALSCFAFTLPGRFPASTESM
eukprot:4279489-Amphidinium_carterae.1